MINTLKISTSSAISKNNREYQKPNEDFALCDQSNSIFMVLDGVSRDQTDGTYPDPSPSAHVTHEFGDIVHSLLLACADTEADIAKYLAQAVKRGNERIREVNSAATWDFLPGTVGIIAVIAKDVFHYVHIGDCRGRLIRQGHVTQFTSVQTKSIHEHVGEFTKDYIRNTICNNTSHPYGYGVFTGQESAIDFLEQGQIKLEAGDVIILSTDGLEKVLSKVNAKDYSHWSADEIVHEAINLEESAPDIKSDDKAIISIKVCDDDKGL